MHFPSRRFLAALLMAGGTAHLVAPDVYVNVIPRFLGHARALVYASGVVEVAVGALLAGGRTRRVGATAAAALLVVIFPANVQHAVDEGGVWWVRLPLQVPLVWWAVVEARRRDQDEPEKRANSWVSSSAGPDGTM